MIKNSLHVKYSYSETDEIFESQQYKINIEFVYFDIIFLSRG